MPDGLEFGQHPSEQRDERAVDDDDVIFGMVGDVHQLLGEEPDVEGMENRAHSRHGEVGRYVLGVVPHKGADPLVASNTEASQRMSQPCGLLTELCVRSGACSL